MYTVDDLIRLAVIIMAIWGFVKIIMEIIEAVNKRHDREQKWDEYEKNLAEERDKIYTKYDTKLAEIEARIADSIADTDAKIQETRAELYIITECMAAVLDGLKQQGCNGKVTEAKQNLESYLIRRAHE